MALTNFVSHHQWYSNHILPASLPGKYMHGLSKQRVPDREVHGRHIPGAVEAGVDIRFAHRHCNRLQARRADAELLRSSAATDGRDPSPDSQRRSTRLGSSDDTPQASFEAAKGAEENMALDGMELSTHRRGSYSKDLVAWGKFGRLTEFCQHVLDGDGGCLGIGPVTSFPILEA